MRKNLLSSGFALITRIRHWKFASCLQPYVTSSRYRDVFESFRFKHSDHIGLIFLTGSMTTLEMVSLADPNTVIGLCPTRLHNNAVNSMAFSACSLFLARYSQREHSSCVQAIPPNFAPLADMHSSPDPCPCTVRSLAGMCAFITFPAHPLGFTAGQKITA